MKKALYIFIAVLMLGTFSGCGKEEKTTTCTIDRSSYNETQKLTGKDKVEQLEMTYVYDNSLFNIETLNTLTDEQKEQIKTSMLTNLGFDKTSYEGFEILVDIQDKMTVTMKIDIAKADTSVTKKVGIDFTNTNLDYDDAVKSYEDLGYTCK